MQYGTLKLIDRRKFDTPIRLAAKALKSGGNDSSYAHAHCVYSNHHQVSYMFSPFPSRSPFTFGRGSSRKVLENDPGLVSMPDEELWDWEVLGHPGSPTRAPLAITQPERWAIDPPPFSSLPLRNNVISPATTQLGRRTTDPPLIDLRLTNNVLRSLPAIPQLGRHTAGPAPIDALRLTNNVVLRPLPAIPQLGRRTTDPVTIGALRLTNNVTLRPLPAIPQLERRTAEPAHIDLLRLPNDVISQIFYHACLPIPGDNEWRRPFYPLWLGKLCRAWRGIAWTTSELWTTVVLRVYHPDRTECRYRDQANLLAEWLQRAKGRKLHVYIGEAKGNKAVAPPLPLMELLATRSSVQWQDVHICLPKNWEPLLNLIATPVLPPLNANDISDINAEHALRPFTALYPPSLPNLQSFVIQQSDVHPFRIPLINLSPTPSLKIVKLLNIPIHILDLAESFPCAQITEITVTTSTPWNPRDFLALFPRLQSLIFVNCPYGRIREQVTHQKLQSLCIRSSGYELRELEAYTKFMKLPALKMLEVVQPGYIKYTQYLLRLVECSSCHLTSLMLECFVCLEHDLINFLFSLDTLVELHIRDSEAPVPRYTHIEANQRGLGQTFFDVLDPDEEASFLPNLEILLYKGLLSVQAIDFIEPFIVRSRIRGGQNAGVNGVALLKQATIIADQYSEVAELSIAEYWDPQYIWEIVRMGEEGVLVLHNMDGSRWS